MSDLQLSLYNNRCGLQVNCTRLPFTAAAVLVKLAFSTAFKRHNWHVLDGSTATQLASTKSESELSLQSVMLVSNIMLSL